MERAKHACYPTVRYSLVADMTVLMFCTISLAGRSALDYSTISSWTTAREKTVQLSEKCASHFVFTL